MSYMSELAAQKYRARIMILLGSFFATSNLIIPGMAWLILPYEWDFHIIEDYLGIIKINPFTSLGHPFVITRPCTLSLTPLSRAIIHADAAAASHQ